MVNIYDRANNNVAEAAVVVAAVVVVVEVVVAERTAMVPIVTRIPKSVEQVTGPLDTDDECDVPDDEDDSSRLLCAMTLTPQA